MSKRGPTLKTMRSVAALRELADLGLYASQAGRLLGLTDGYVCLLRKRFSIAFTKGPPGLRRNEELHRLIEEGYARNLPPRVIAEMAGTTIKTIMVLACKKGLTRGRKDPGAHRRGYRVPEELWPRYRELRKLGLTIAECGYELGLLERPKARAA